MLRVVAPLPEAQLVESRLINLVHYSTMNASKAARTVLAAPGKRLVDFGLRRSHGAEAGLLAARSAYLAGFAGTSAVSAGMAYGIPVFGTMAHSFVQAHEDEARAFEDFARVFPRTATLLIDTYDTEDGARKVAALAPRLRAEGIEIGGVRLDSGDLGALAKSVRRILDEAGLGRTTIFASGNLDDDAPEAYIHDITRPLKRHLDGYQGIERVNWHAIAAAFRVDPVLPKSVHVADTSMLFVELRALLREPPAPWGFEDPGLAKNVRIECWSPEVAKLEFTGRFLELILERSRKCA